MTRLVGNGEALAAQAVQRTNQNSPDIPFRLGDEGADESIYLRDVDVADVESPGDVVDGNRTLQGTKLRVDGGGDGGTQERCAMRFHVTAVIGCLIVFATEGSG